MFTPSFAIEQELAFSEKSNDMLIFDLVHMIRSCIDLYNSETITLDQFHECLEIYKNQLIRHVKGSECVESYVLINTIGTIIHLTSNQE